MANTYTQIHLHIIFAVRGRAALIPQAHADTLYRYITGIITQHGQKLLVINGMPDHLHLLIGLLPDKALSDLMRDVKANSSKFINEQKWLPGKFAWQEGFGAFSYGASQLPQVINYIEQQQAHHASAHLRRNTNCCCSILVLTTTPPTFSRLLMTQAK